jgi:hypothetical protein
MGGTEADDSEPTLQKVIKRMAAQFDSLKDHMAAQEERMRRRAEARGQVHPPPRPSSPFMKAVDHLKAPR